MLTLKAIQKEHLSLMKRILTSLIGDNPEPETPVPARRAIDPIAIAAGKGGYIPELNLCSFNQAVRVIEDYHELQLARIQKRLDNVKNWN